MATFMLSFNVIFFITIDLNCLVRRKIRFSYWKNPSSMKRLRKLLASQNVMDLWFILFSSLPLKLLSFLKNKTEICCCQYLELICYWLLLLSLSFSILFINIEKEEGNCATIKEKFTVNWYCHLNSF